jgi:TIR domain
MGVFICWSGAGSRSHQLARILSERIPEILQNADVFLSEHDIGPGQPWMEELRKALKENRFGILCVTPENQNNLWIHFEAGSLWKGDESTRVCPLLFKTTRAEITGPLAQLQSIEFERSEFFRLMSEVNEQLGEKRISESLLQKCFDRVWDDLKEDASKIKQPSAALPTKRTPESMIEEILTIVRSIQHAYQAEKDSVNLSSERIAEILSAASKPVAVPGVGYPNKLSGAITPSSLNLGNLKPIYGGDVSEKPDKNTKS